MVLLVGEVEGIDTIDDNFVQILGFLIIDIDLIGLSYVAEIPNLADFASGVVDFFIGLARGKTRNQKSH
jgi:hypothetical protein